MSERGMVCSSASKLFGLMRKVWTDNQVLVTWVPIIDKATETESEPWTIFPQYGLVLNQGKVSERGGM